MTPFYADESVTLYHGDCLDVLRELPDASVDAVVTDPPAGIGFMGREWDHHKGGREQWVAWLGEVMAEALRVTKPGGHAFVWAMPRTSHWTATALEDAGWDIRDCVVHLFGSGFPKSLDVSKAIDKALGAAGTYGEPKSAAHAGHIGKAEYAGDGKEAGWTRPWMSDAEAIDKSARKYKAGSPEAEAWQGWGTALKPASEHWWLARKPLTSTVAGNVLAYGTGALNIDGTRVGTSEDTRRPFGTPSDHVGQLKGLPRGELNTGSDLGRWPSNVVLDESQAAELDKQSGNAAPKAERTGRKGGSNPNPMDWETRHTDQTGTWPGDPGGGASRFFPTFKYEPKAPTTERPRDGQTAHPTVKPLDLMRWLVRLVTPPGGTVLEPFAGSGTTAEACVIEGFNCIAIEREADYLPLIVQRLSKPIQVALDFDSL